MRPISSLGIEDAFQWHIAADHGLSVKEFGAVGDGVTDDAKAFQAALTSAASNGHGVIFIPKSDSYYRISTPLAWSGNHVQMIGQNAEIRCDSGVRFVVFTGASIANATIEHLRVTTTNADLFAYADNAGLMNLVIRYVNHVALGTSGAFYHQHNTSPGTNIVGLYINNCWHDVATENTSPVIHVDITNAGGFNCVEITNCNYYMNGNTHAPAISIVSRNGGSYNYDINLRNLIFENPLGGAIKLNGVWGGLLSICHIYDLVGTTTADLFEIGKAAGGGLGCRYVTLNNCGVIGGMTAGVGLYAIDLTDAALCTLESCSGTGTFSINEASGEHTFINCKPAELINHSGYSAVVSGQVSTIPVISDTVFPAAPIEGQIVVNRHPSVKAIKVWDGYGWRDIATW
jgi:hypothetical protein